MENFTMQLCRHRGGRLVLLIFIMLLVGCSLARFGYNNGESLSYWWLNTYVDINSDQRPWVKNHLAHLFAWHRKTQLDDYRRLLAQIQQDLSRSVTPVQALGYYDQFKQRAWIVVEQALPSLADLALALTPQQIAHLEEKFTANNEEYRKEHLSADIDHRQESRYKKIMQQAEYWFGDFSREQQAQIRQASDARPLNNALWMQERLRRQQNLIALLKKIQADKPNHDAVIAMLRTYAQDVFDLHEQAERPPFFAASRRASAELAALIINQATPAQKAHAVKRLQKWIDNFQALAARPE